MYDPIGQGGVYTGHDEPQLNFYSDTPGSGASSIYQVRLPNDPPTLPQQDGTGGTFNFQLHIAFWFGMTLCDSQSAPEYTNTCVPNTDANIFDSPNPSSPNYIGKHPGSAFMELQFYPPGWAPWPLGVSCDSTQWCSALAIFSYNSNMNFGVPNNAACLNLVGVEPANFAFVTKNGTAHAPADPFSVATNLATGTPNPSTDLFMNSGDVLKVAIHDTPSGVQTVIHDLTSGEDGSMTASVANGFAQVNYDPTASTCTETPYAFHPMYSTSETHTRVPWAAHTGNIAFADEIGHFEYCNQTDESFGPGVGGACIKDGVHDTDATLSGAQDDFPCFDSSFSTRVQITGCIGTDADFDGPMYQHNWPGTLNSPEEDKKVHAQPIVFTSPLFRSTHDDGLKNYDRVAFEADLPRIEFDTIPQCQRFISNPSNSSPGAGCVNPPVGASFYPIFTTGTGTGDFLGGSCVWQFGGPNLPGTTHTFGGNSRDEYGPLLSTFYPEVGFTITYRYNNFQNPLDSNPCPAQLQNNDNNNQIQQNK